MKLSLTRWQPPEAGIVFVAFQMATQPYKSLDHVECAIPASLNFRHNELRHAQLIARAPARGGTNRVSMQQPIGPKHRATRRRVGVDSYRRLIALQQCWPPTHVDKFASRARVFPFWFFFWGELRHDCGRGRAVRGADKFQFSRVGRAENGQPRRRAARESGRDQPGCSPRESRPRTTRVLPSLATGPASSSTRAYGRFRQSRRSAACNLPGPRGPSALRKISSGFRV